MLTPCRPAAAVMSVGIGALLLGVLGGCNEPEESITGTNTNWLKRCVESDDCAGGLACVCGRCSMTCSDDNECPLGTLCSSSRASLVQCAGEAVRSCQAACSDSAECEQGQLCHLGACVDRLSPLDCSLASDALVCEDFEADVSAYAVVNTEGNNIEALPSATPSGAAALAAEVTAAPSVSYLRADFPAQQAGTLYLSGFVHVPQSPSGYDLAPLGLWSSQEIDWALRLVVKDGALELWSYTTPAAQPVPLVPGAWHCLQASITLGDGDGSVSVRVDGEAAIDGAALDTLPTGGVDALTMGTQWAGAPAEIQVDRVLFGPTETGCW